MSALTDAMAKGNTALNDLLALQNKAIAAGDTAKQNSLQSAMDDLTFQLNRLRGAAIAADDARIAPLNAQLDKVTQTATTAMGNLSKAEAVLSAIAAIASIIDSILGIVSRL